ncbi:MAG: nucleoside deaminase [Bacteroidota bacterium]
MNEMSNEQKFMKEAILVSMENIQDGGGPFGAVVVKNGEIIARSGNSVTRDNDPTAHAEINAIRAAARALNSFDLSGCVIYSSCEPCPMCLSAVYWARIDRIYYGNNRYDAAEIGFDDNFLYEELRKDLDERSIPIEQLERDEALKTFATWRELENKIPY